MARPRKAQKTAAARARAGKVQKKLVSDSNDSDLECTGWSGGVNHVLSDSEHDEDWEDVHSVSEDSTADDSDSDGDLEELEGQDLLEGLEKHWEVEQEMQDLMKPMLYDILMGKKMVKEWKRVEAKRGLGYNGLSDRRKREINQKQREKEERDKDTRKR